MIRVGKIYVMDYTVQQLARVGIVAVFQCARSSFTPPLPIPLRPPDHFLVLLHPPPHPTPLQIVFTQNSSPPPPLSCPASAILAVKINVYHVFIRAKVRIVAAVWTTTNDTVLPWDLRHGLSMA